MSLAKLHAQENDTFHVLSRIAIAIAIVACLALAGVLAGCGGASPAQVADSYLKALQTGGDSGESIDGIVTSAEDGEDPAATGGLDAETNKLIAEKLQSFQYTIGNEKVEGDSATVDVTITTYDMGEVMTSFLTNYMQQGVMLALGGATEEQLNELAIQLLTDELNNAQMSYQETVPLAMAKQDGNWVVEDIDGQADFVNAITGGLFATIEGYANAASSQGATS